MSADAYTVLKPRFTNGQAAGAFARYATELAACEPRGLDSLRDAWLARFSPSATDGQVLRVCISVLADLRAQGWTVLVQNDAISIAQPTAHSADPSIQKERVKRGHLRERDYQLTLPSVRQ